MLDLNDDTYTITQSLIRNKYKVENSKGELVLRAKQDILSIKDSFTFVDSEGNEVLNAKDDKMLDFTETLTLYKDGEAIASISQEFSFMKDVWTIRDPETGEELAKIKTSNFVYPLLRNFVGNIASLIPHVYNIEQNGTKIGSMKGKLSLRDKYVLRLDKDPSNTSREKILASAMVLDALEMN